MNRLLTPAELADYLAVERSWVYAHAAELGAWRLGTGEKGRLRFDLETVRARLTPCDGGKGSPSRETAPAQRLRPVSPRPLGTNAPLLPIRGRKEAA